MFLPELPILGGISIKAMHDTQPFLFWTIMAIATSRLPLIHEIYPDIKGPYARLVGEEVLKAPLPVHKIQALLFLSTWPLPVTEQALDPSWLYCGVALQAVRSSGLDRKPSVIGFMRASGEARDGLLAWVGCFYVCVS